MSFINPTSRNPFEKNVGKQHAGTDVSRRLIATSEAVGAFPISPPAPLPPGIMLQRHRFTQSSRQNSGNNRVALCFQRAVLPSQHGRK